MKKKLVWNAFYSDFNDGRLKTVNVIRDDLIEEIKKAKKKGLINTHDDLRELVKRNLMYYYWSKTEWEYMLTPMFRGKEEKHDVWYQVEMNLDRLVEYLWDNLIA